MISMTFTEYDAPYCTRLRDSHGVTTDCEQKIYFIDIQYILGKD